MGSRLFQNMSCRGATKKKYCLYYNRFGKCTREKCKLIHDPKRIAVCRSFLKGACVQPDCPFVHRADREKMPVCYHFIRGICSKEDCPYLHVNVARDAKVCEAFLEGYCELGENCPNKHIIPKNAKKRGRDTQTISTENSQTPSSKRSRPASALSPPTLSPASRASEMSLFPCFLVDNPSPRQDKTADPHAMDMQ
eukprot:Rmarinus@m.6329